MSRAFLCCVLVLLSQAWVGRMEVQLSILHGHDANACIAVDGEIVAVLELERLLNQRHFHCPGPIEEFERFRRCWEGAIEWLLAEAGNPPSIDLAVVLSRRPVSPILQEEASLRRTATSP